MWAKRGQTPRFQEPQLARNDENPRRCRGFESGSDGRRSRDLTIFSRALYQLSYRAVWLTKTAPPEEGAASHSATLTGLEPATSAVTGRHANQLRYRAMLLSCVLFSDPNGIRTRAAAVKGRCPRPLNDGAVTGEPQSNRGSSIRAARRKCQSPPNSATAARNGRNGRINRASRPAQVRFNPLSKVDPRTGFSPRSFNPGTIREMLLLLTVLSV